MNNKRLSFASTGQRNRNHPYIKNELPFKLVYKPQTFIKAERGRRRCRDPDWRRQHEFHPDVKPQSNMLYEGPGSSRQTHYSGLERRTGRDLQLHEPDIKQETFTDEDEDEGETFDLKTYVLEMIVTDLQTPRLVEEDGFRHFMKALNPSSDAALNARAIRQDLVNMYVSMRRKVKVAVRNAKDPMLSAELWMTSEKESYLTVTCHFMDTNWEPKSYTLDTAQLLGEQTLENVHLNIWRISTEWELMEKIQVVVINLDGMKKNKVNSKWTYIPCFSHILNKVLLEVLDSPDWRYLLKKCRRVVQFFHQENESSWSHHLAQSACVGWLSTLNMVEKICKQWPRLSKISSYKKTDSLWLNENERKLLENMMKALTVVKDVTWEIGERGYISISNIIPVLDKLQSTLGRLKQRDNKVAVRLSEKLNYHFGKINQNMFFTLSTALDPRFKSSVLKTDAGGKVKTAMREEMCKQASSRCLRNILDHEDVVSQYATEGDISASQCPLQYWKAKTKSKVLAMVAHKYLGVISTAIPIERMMHEDKSQIFFNRKKCLELKDINMMLFLNGNHQKI